MTERGEGLGVGLAPSSTKEICIIYMYVECSVYKKYIYNFTSNNIQDTEI